jgi:FkbM family methyltransferase
LFPPTYEPKVVAAIRRNVDPGPTCVDTGAHAGAITRALAGATGSAGRVIAFETYPPSAANLREKLRSENLNWVTVENITVTDGTEQVVWLHPGRGRWSAEWNVVGHDVDGNMTHVSWRSGRYPWRLFPER